MPDKPIKRMRLVFLCTLEFFLLAGLLASIAGLIYYGILLEPDWLDIPEGILSVLVFGYLSFRVGKKILHV